MEEGQLARSIHQGTLVPASAQSGSTHWVHFALAAPRQSWQAGPIYLMQVAAPSTRCCSVSLLYTALSFPWRLPIGRSFPFPSKVWFVLGQDCKFTLNSFRTYEKHHLMKMAFFGNSEGELCAKSIGIGNIVQLAPNHLVSLSRPQSSHFLQGVMADGLVLPLETPV